MAGGITTIGWSFLLGVVPVFFWLWFWLRNDRHQEPRGLLALTFIAGAAIVPLVIPIENWAHEIANNSNTSIIMISVIEEISKFLLVMIIVLGTRQIEEPIDYAVYLITGALGFAALENMFFIMNPVAESGMFAALNMGNLRFLGATVLHAVTAAVVGVSIGTVFFRPAAVRMFFGLLGLASGIALHAIFNFFIMSGTQTNIIATIAVLWVVMIFLASMLRKLGQMVPPRGYYSS